MASWSIFSNVRLLYPFPRHTSFCFFAVITAVPSTPPQMEVYVHPLDEAGAASKYIVRQTSKAAHRTGSLSSSFASTPKLLRAVLRRPPPRRPATELLEKATWRDYLGVIPNPGHEPNSLLFGKGKAAYEVRGPNGRSIGTDLDQIFLKYLRGIIILSSMYVVNRVMPFVALDRRLDGNNYRQRF